jgi:radical SAM superfamily enzyme YgiQ (UPF0313 family)
MNWKQKKKIETLLAAERGGIKKVWGTGYSVCLAYPNVYRIGMANLGFQSVYKIFNDLPSFLCERVFLPEPGVDAAQAVSLESQKPLRDFDILAFSVSFENDYPSILKILDLAGIPLKACDRLASYPLVLGGGIALTLNPEPLSDFFDLLIPGEAEDVLPRFAHYFAASRQSGQNRSGLLIALQKQMKGIYVPALFAPRYLPDGKIKKIEPLVEGLQTRIQVLPVKNISAFEVTEIISGPEAEMAEMFLIEVNRGCPHLCRFCAAGHVYAPPRFRGYDQIVAAIDRGLTIKKKIGLVGTAVSDHPDLCKIISYITKQNASVGIGSLRLDQISDNLLELLAAGGIETVALAPEAGSQRLRDLLAKGIAEADILRATELLISRDIQQLRLYFMVGLPTEKDEDIDAIIDLVKKIQRAALCRTEGKKKFRRITLSINQFIPKPRTPLQWQPLADTGDVGEKIKKIVQAFRQDKQINVIADVPKWNYIQALLCLGDRRVGDILLAVHRMHGNWPRALREVSINCDFYVYRQKDLDEILPWDIIEVGVSRKALEKAYVKTMKNC